MPQLDIPRILPIRFNNDGPVQLFGKVTLLEGYDALAYKGCHALVELRDEPSKTVAILSTEIAMQNLLATALSTGNLISFSGEKLSNPPTPLGGTWNVDVYSIYNIIVYGS